MKFTVVLLVICFLTSCASVEVQATQPVLPSPVVVHTTRPVTPYPTPTRAPTWTPVPTQARGPTVTPFPSLTPPTSAEFAKYTINALRSRSYGGGTLTMLGNPINYYNFTRYIISYPSDGLTIGGFISVPKGDGPFPVIIILHGYSDPASYETFDYTTSIADDLGAQGYIILHPNFRNFKPSDSGDALFRAGYAIDVLNLIGIVRENAGQDGLLKKANANWIGLWGHSLGGAIALKVAVISPYLKAVVLYAPMSGDESRNSLFFSSSIGGKDGQKEMTATTQDFAELSPNTYYKYITAPIQIHHGTGDTVINVLWSDDTCNELLRAGVTVKCYFYDGAEHTFRAVFIADYKPRVDDFFATYLKK